MKRLIPILLALTMLLALPAMAAPAPVGSGSSPTPLGSVTIVDGTTNITFNNATQSQKAILRSQQTWVEGSATSTATAAERTDIDLVTVQKSCYAIRTVNNGPVTITFLTYNGSNYVEAADELSLYALTFPADNLFAYPFARADLCRLKMPDGTEVYLIQEGVALHEAPPVAINYQVKPGDSVELIALNYYGVRGLGEALMMENAAHFQATGGILEAGRFLVLPPSLKGITRLSSPLAGDKEVLYIVKAGDTLASIAAAYYGGKSNYYTYIYDRNKDRMKNASQIQVGQVLVLPVINLP